MSQERKVSRTYTDRYLTVRRTDELIATPNLDGSEWLLTFTATLVGEQILRIDAAKPTPRAAASRLLAKMFERGFYPGSWVLEQLGHAGVDGDVEGARENLQRFSGHFQNVLAGALQGPHGRVVAGGLQAVRW